MEKDTEVNKGYGGNWRSIAENRENSRRVADGLEFLNQDRGTIKSKVSFTSFLEFLLSTSTIIIINS